ncbi:DUF6802 family protein [uncultured Corynebacterium sp.]|uniref:DUF6802 family protein n=1 Tax=uncultured Corynebacterium sp. TaxID=159447 RepID=UPI0025F955EA|nr:DUF6802 family protein [uncultured Corynebacterium sp.]
MSDMTGEALFGGLGGAGGVGDAGVGPDAACGLDGAAALATGETGEGMILEIGGEYFDLGPGIADTDADGVSDSVTLADDRGLSIYSDIDGDGAVDHVTTVLFDGTYETWTVPTEFGGKTFGGTPTGVEGDRSAVVNQPGAWGIHEWERGESGRWA